MLSSRSWLRPNIALLVLRKKTWRRNHWSRWLVVSKIQAGPKAQGFWVAHVQRTLHPEVHQNPGPIWLVNDPQVSILHVAVVHLDGGYWIEAADAVQRDVESLEKV